MQASKPEGEFGQVADLSPEQLALLMLRLREKAQSRATPDPQPLDIQPAPRDGALPLSFAQQRLWFLAQLEPDAAAYHIPIALRMDGPLDVAAFRRSLRALAQRHEVLRTTFAAVDGQAVQVIGPALADGAGSGALITLLDLRALGDAAREGVLRRAAEAEFARPFDLARGPLIRATLLRLGPDDHAILFTLHHIISDGWSTPIFMRELGALYLAATGGPPARLPDLPVQYADYAVWQRAWLQGERLERQLAYWRARLADLPALDLPADRPRPHIATYRGGRIPLVLPAALSDALAGLSQRRGGTLFMTLLAAFAALLARHSDQDDIVIGTDIANRVRARTEGLIGFFINQLVLRLDLSGDPTVAELLDRARRTCQEAYERQDLPFEQLVAEIQPDRRLNRTPLFQVKLILQNAPPQPPAPAESRLRPLPTAHTSALFDLLIALEETPHGLVGMVSYSADLFDASRIARMAGHFQNLLAGVAADGARRAGDLPLLSPAERQQILVEWNVTEGVRGQGSGVRGREENRLLHEQVAEQAARTPDAVALVFYMPLGEGLAAHLTYGELNRRANQLAHHLRGLGVGPDVLAAICLERSPELIIALLGVLKAGSAYLPLDPSYPPERLAYMLDDSLAPVLLTRQGLVDDLPPFWGALISLDADWPRIAQASDADPDHAALPDHLAYVIYTSGSTGSPKGVQIRHGALARRVRALAQAFGLAPGGRLLQFVSLSFDASAEEIYPTLTSGAGLVIVPGPAELPPADLLRIADRAGVTVLHIPPAYWYQMTDFWPASGPSFRRLDLWVTGGERSATEKLAALATVVGRPARFIHVYGPTEATITSSFYASALSPALGALPALPIGRPIANTRIYLLDRRMQPAPIGAPGEIHVGGPGLARGYLGRPDLTAAAFVPNPFVEGSGIWGLGSGSEPRSLIPDLFAEGSGVWGLGSDSDPRSPIPDPRLYRTGDLARYLPDGSIVFLGRRDEQVKIRGHRIELGEVEAALRQHPRVREALALAREDAPGDVRLVAYVVTSDEFGVTSNAAAHPDASGSSLVTRHGSLSADLRAYLAARLPAYMLPAAIVPLADLPLTPNGKVDRRALPAPEAAQEGQGGDAFAAPRTQIEALLAQIWAEALDRERVGVDENFFAIGGHSLLVTQLISRIVETFQVELPFRDVFDAPTVADLAERIVAARRADAAPAAPPLVAAGLAAAPLSFAQQRLWFLAQLDPASPAYNIPIAVRLDGRLVVAALARSLNAIIARHAALRTTFAEVGGQPVQRVAPARPARLALVDLHALPADMREAAARRLAAREARDPFDLARGPLIRAALIRLRPQAHLALLTMHHIVSDGWSASIFMRELAAGYAADLSDRPADLPDLPIQYADYAAWQRAWLQGSALAAHLAYWQRQLAGLPALRLPTDRPRPPSMRYEGAEREFTLPAALGERLAATCRQAGVTVFMALLAAFQALLARYSGQDDIAVGTDVANRTRIETEPLIGFFVNQLVLRGDLSGGPTGRELLARVRETTLDAYAHQDLPFEELVRALNPDRSLAHAPLFQAKIILQNVPAAPDELAGLALSPLADQRRMVQFDLLLFVNETPAGLFGSLQYRTDLFDGTTIARMLRGLRALLDALVADPDRRVADLPLLDLAERAQLLREWNDTAVPGADMRPVHHLFEEQAARTPDAVALALDDVTKDEELVLREAKERRTNDASGRPSSAHLTYAELNARANRLAHHLRALGIGPEARVAIALERSADLVVAILGVLKAGSAYLPLDPSYPTERLAFMLDDSMAAALLTSERFAEAAPASWAMVIALDAEQEAIVRRPAENPPGLAGADSLAYVIYTSGSTGTPKGVMVAHRGLGNLARAQIAAFDVRPGSRVLQFAALGFDAAVSELWMALLAGATLALPGSDAELAGPALAERLAAQAITTVTLPPAILATLPAAPLPDLRTLIVAGEACPGDLAARWGCGRRLCNAYGPTEATVCATIAAVRAAPPPIGRPIAAVQTYVLDRELRPTPLGVAGELHIGGIGLARGYLGRPDLTAAAFIPNPFTQASGAGGQGSDPAPRPLIPDPRIYRTGDLARYRSDGELEFLGRIDAQIKLRGFRVEPGEVAAALARHPAVRSAAVLLREDAPGERRLVAYVVPGSAVGGQGPGMTAQDDLIPDPRSLIPALRAFLAATLPAHMIPAAFVALDRLPLTPSGKLDRDALPAPDAAAPAPASAAPQTPAEQLLAGLWREALRVEQVGRHDNFFALGGDSILSMQVVARARQSGLRLTPRLMFQHQTIAELARAAGVAESALIETDPASGPTPLTPIQRWFFAQDQPDPQHYNQALLLDLKRPLDWARVGRALTLVQARHDALRLRFARDEGGWSQTVAAGAPRVLPQLIDLAALPDPARDATTTRVAAALHRSLDLASGPILRAALFADGDRRPSRLLVIVHHLAVDAVSWRVLLDDLQSAYAQLDRDEDPQIAPASASFQAWATRLRDYAESEDLRAELGYWLDPARRAAAPLPLDFADGSNAVASAQAVAVALSAEETRALLHDVPSAYRTRVNDALLAALAQTLAEWAGGRAALIDLEGHGREDLFDELDLSRTVGWFTTIYPALLDLRGASAPGAAIKAVKEQLRAVPQNGVGYGILRYLGPPEARAQLAALPQAQVSFNYLGQIDQAVAEDGVFGLAALATGPAQSPRALRSHALEVNGAVAGGRLRLEWSYSGEIHRRATIARLAERYLDALRALIAHCRAPGAFGYTPSDFPLARLDQRALDRLAGAERGIEDIYPLAPLQQGLLFHTLHSPGEGEYLAQLACTLRGELRPDLFQRAWREVIARHAILRTGFAWAGVDEPVQIVHAGAPLPWEAEDWRALAPGEQEARLAERLARWRTEGFALDRPPLMRLALFRLDNDAYRFIWIHHHLLLDGWSVAILLNEVFGAYLALAEGRAPDAPPPPRYRDYIAWLQRQDRSAAERFWRGYLRDFDAATPLGVDGLPAPEGAPDYAARQARLGADQSDALQALARRHGLTIGTLLYGAWALLLARYSGAREVVFGATVAGRPPELPGYDSIVGLFINTLPVRVAAPRDGELAGWLRALQAQQADLRQYEHTPLVAVQGWSGVPRGQPLFESIVVVENYPIGGSVQAQAERPGPSIDAVQVVERTNYPLTLEAIPGPPLSLRISYQGRRFDAATIARMLGHLRALLAGVAGAATLAELDPLTPAERQQILAEWNDAPGIRDQGSGVRGQGACGLLHDLFAAQAARSPDAVALAFHMPSGEDLGEGCAPPQAPSSYSDRGEAAHLTYAALERRANQLARHLRALGCGPEDRVALIMPRSPEAIIALMAALKAGSAFVPLDPSYPPERLRFMIEDSQACIIVTNGQGRTTNSGDDLTFGLRPSSFVDLRRNWPAIARLPGAPLDGGSAPGHLAYLIYTSGSTGRPKGVTISHASAARFFTWYGRYFGLRPDDRIIQYHSLSFDFSTWEIFEALIAGASLQLTSEAAARDVGALVEQIERARISVLNMTPSQFSALADYAAHERPAALARLRLLVLGGELLPGALARRAARLTAPDCRFYNEYGPTETTISSSILRIDADALRRIGGRPGAPIGRPIGDTQFYVLDADMRPQPIGAPGELYIGGFGLARGYHARPDLTAAAFVPNPFVAVGSRQASADNALTLDDRRRPTADCRLYQTGDLARLLPNGMVEILGRRDSQVKLRGYRIEPDEIAATLAQHPSVRNCVVVPRADAPGDARLVAYVVQGSGVSGQGPGGAASDDLIPDPRSLIPALRAWLAARLPAYMIPSAFVLMDALPLTPSGKIDRRALPAPEAARGAPDAAFADPRTPDEDLLAAIWADVLRVDRVGVHDSFFALGGHSLIATQAIARVRDAFQVELPLRTLFEDPTVAGLAARIAQARREGSTDKIPPLVPQPRAGDPPLSFAQQRLWFLDQFQPGSPAYNIPAAFRISGPLDLDALAHSLAAVIRRHETLRTTFALRGDRPVQLIAGAGWPDDPRAGPPIALIDLRGLGPETRESAALRLARAEDLRPFDLARGPIIRAALARLGAEDHALLVTLHHIAADAHAMRALFGELAAGYAARAAGRSTDLPALPIQYADYAIWQRAWPDALVEAQLAYWRDQLADPPTLDLPTDRPRPVIETFRGAQQSFALPDALGAGLRALGRARGATLFMTLLAAWQALLARYSGQSDVVVGSPIAGRAHQALADLIGLFLNTLPLRADLSGDPSFEELLARVRAACLGAYAHQDLPFEQIVEALQPARDMGRHPLFQALFTLEYAPPAAMDLPGLDIRPLPLARTTVTYDLILSLQEGAGGLTGTLGYRADLFDATTIARMLGSFRTMLEALVADPARPVAALPLMSAAQTRQILVEWNDTAGAGGQGSGVRGREENGLLHELVAAQAARTPDAVALAFGEDERRTTNDERFDPSATLRAAPMQLTYAALDGRANQMAHYLRRMGVGPEDRVALMVERSAEMLTALLGVLKAGSAYVPLDPSYPSERIRFMLEDSGARVLVTNDEGWTTNEQTPSFALGPWSLADLRADWPAIAAMPGEAPEVALDPASLAYVIYTSGSTGRPKGVMIAHRALANLLGSMRIRPGIRSGDRLLAVTTLAFDIAALELFLPLISGACADLASRETAADGAALAARLARGATIMQATPATWRMLLDAGWTGDPRLRALCGGEALPPDLARRLRAACADLWNMYGPTETTIWSAAQPVARGAAHAAIGRPIADTRLHVLDRRMQPVPIGVAGELYIGGSGLARGYHARPDLTAAAFVPNPFVRGSGVRGQGSDPDPRSPIPDPRLYRTGDLARHRPDGSIEFLGRIDAQIKLRGYRIELGEIGAALERHPSVRSAAALLREDAPGDARLVAYIVTSYELRVTSSADATKDERRKTKDEGSAIDDAPLSSLVLRPSSLAADLRAHLAATLPAYMIPSAFVELDALPLTPNGKLDNRALRALAPDPRAGQGFAEARSPAEALLAQLWADVLRVERVGAHDNFFALGGHSLLATQIVSRVRDAFGVELPIRSMFEDPTVAGLAARIARADGGADQLAPPLRPAARDGSPPLSFAQQRLWFLDQLDPGDPAYAMPAALRLSGSLDLAALAESLRAVIRRHEALRTVFPADDGRPAQRIAAPGAIRLFAAGGAPLLPLLDLRALPEGAPESHARRLAQIEARRPFDLAAGPLFRATLLRLGAREHVVLLTMHHIIADAWSVGVLVREISALYTARAGGGPADLPALPIQYADYAIWQRAWLHGSALDAQLGYWKRQLAGLPTLDLPTDRPRPLAATYHGARRGFTLPAGLRADLAALSRRAGATMFMTLLAAFDALLARYSGQDDVVVGTPIAGRTRAETEPLIGYFVNTLALRVDLAGAATFNELLARARAACLGAYAHQDAPFEQVVDALQPERDLSRHPLFQVMFALQNAPLGALALADLQPQMLAVEHATAQFDLSLSLEETAGGFSGTLEYLTDLFDATTMARLLGHFRTLLEGIAARPDARLRDLPLLSAAEQRQLHEWNDTAVRRGADDWLLHDLFEAQAARTPDAVAATFDRRVGEAQHLSYQALDRRANQLARHLRALGAGPEARVGIALPRSAELPIAMLGVLKAGSAYLPLDPDYPAERIRFMLEDSRAGILVTNDEGRRLLVRPSSFVLRPSSLIDLRVDWPAIAHYPAAPLPRVAAPANPAYLIYTSGSTGRPKGVLAPHAALVNYALDMARRFELRPGDRVLQFAALGFDVVAEELFPAWAGGSAVALHDRDLSAALDDFADLMDRARVTVVELPAPYWHAWADELERTGAAAPPALRLALVGCELLDPARVARWRRTGVALMSVFGLTETVITSATHRLPGSAAAPPTPPVGRPVANTQIYVLDPHMRRQPIGVAGELYIGGSGLARGYHARPDLTAAAFLPNPFTKGSEVRDQESDPDPRSPIPDPRLYRTGDLARWRSDGRLEFLGRGDRQIKLRGYRVELGEVEAALLAHPAVRACVALAREDAPGDRRLVAYIVQGSGVRGQGSDDTASERLNPDPQPLIPALRAWLAARLPAYMIPVAFVELDALPLTPNGKIDRRALPAPGQRAAPDDAFADPRTPAERRLAEIWRGVLNVERVGRDDNFFALGGDSILSIQIIARARQAGLLLTAKQLFQHQTLADLAAAAGVATAARSEQGPVEGPAPLTPIQRWFFAQELPDPHYFNQALLLSVRQPLDLALLDRAMRKLLEHHDALRLRFARAEDGWRQRNAAAEPQCVVARADVAALPDPARSPAITAAATQAQASLDLERGPIVRAVLFDYGDGQPNRLLMIVHHLAIDGVSWRILLEDLQSAYAQIRRGDPARLPAKTAAFRDWAARLPGYARSETLLGEQGYWLADRRAAAAPLPRDYAGGSNQIGTAQRVVAALDADETRALLHDVPSAYHSQINDALLAALAQALAPWTGRRALLIDLEGHGREDLFDDLDLSRTVGWFSTLYPLMIDLEGADDPGAAIKAAKEQLRAVPNRGIGYGLLRYLGPPEAQARLAALPQAELLFNYLGQVDQAAPPDALLGGMAESSGLDQSPLGRRSHLIEINGIVAGGRLELTWTYSPTIHAPATIERLAREYLAALRALIAHCADPNAFGYTPSDFPLARIDQPALDRIAARYRRIEDLYPLTPLQQGILFHTLYAPADALYFSQLHCTFLGYLDRDAFAQAWQQTVDRHPVLRTTFVWEGAPDPLQVVQPSAALPLDQHDWRGMSDDAQRAQLERLIAADQARGFDLARAPLMRLTLIRVADERYHFIWSHHHLLTDGWSTTRLVDEVFIGYTALTQGRAAQIERPRPYRDYIAWLQQQDLAAAEAFWRRALRGISAPTPLVVDHPPSPANGPRVIDLRRPLGAPGSAALQALARRRGLTLNTIVQGSWALLLSRYSGQRDVLFGATVAGRPPELDGVETMVGLFINTLPIRAAAPPDADPLTWLAGLQDQQIELRQYEYTPLVAIQGWSAIPRDHPLFESIVVFENYPANQAIRESGSAQNLAVGETSTLERNNYPLTLTATPGEALDLFIAYDSQRFEAASIARMLGHLGALLDGIAADSARRLADLPLLTRAERQQIVVEWNDTEGVRGQGSGVRGQGSEAASDAGMCLHELFADQAARSPGAVALVFHLPTGGGLGEGYALPQTPSLYSARGLAVHLTYAELDRRANQLAQHLRALGVGPDVRVGVCVERSAELLVALLGVLKAGGAFVPLDPALPVERIALMLDNAQSPVILTQERLADRLPTAWALTLCLDSEWPLIARSPAAPAPPRAAPDQLAYVLYTSGSTGSPKGVMIAHRGLANYLRWCRAAYAAAPDGALLHSPIGFDLTITSLFAPLLSGQRVVLAREAAGGAALDAAMRAGPAFSLLKLTPAHLDLLRARPLDQEITGRVRTLIVGGEALWNDQLAFWRAAAPATRIVNEYGPTETVVGCCVYEVPRAAPAAATPIGRPIANTRIYLLDCRMDPVPVGVPGEIYIGGSQLARGYLGRPDLTAAAFVPNPFTQGSGVSGQGSDPEPRPPIPDPRIYRTGDLARYLPDGSIEFVGRIDAQIKLRGYRIEPGEVAAALLAHPSVRAAAALLRQDAPGDPRLVAYVVPRQGSEIRGQGSGTDPGEDPNPEPRTLIPGLRTFLAARLPAYMIPAAFVELDALPLTSNGKLDHDALPAPADGSAPQETFVAPRTPIEAELARIWSETLGVERVGVYDNFFALGGHSLLATRVAAEVQAAFRHELSLQTLFENPTIAGLAEILIQSEVAQAGDAEVEQMLAELEGLSLEEIDALLGASEESNPYE